ncbi:hypothetical protein SOVF_199640, partial [Spinacia oleracea]
IAIKVLPAYSLSSNPRMNQEQSSLVLQSSSNFSPPEGVKLSYGTAGFRADATLLKSTVYRVGILAALRSIQTKSVIGLMITASHNQVSDNGIKIADPNGGMLSQLWEPFADSLANVADPFELVQVSLPSFFNSYWSFGFCLFCQFSQCWNSVQLFLILNLGLI